MANGSTGNPCMIKQTGIPLHFTATAGTISLQIVSLTGSVTFDCLNTKVTNEVTGASVACTCKSTSISFNGVSGAIYNLDVLYIFMNPVTDKGALREVCGAPTDLDDVDSNFANPTYTIGVT
jgi:hypothetical protein